MMWPRTAEIVLGIWLVLSPLVYGTYAFGYGSAAIDHAAGAVVLMLAAMSFSRTFGWAHVLIVGVALLLVLPSYLTGHPAPAYIQNRIAAGLVLMIFAILPNGVDEFGEIDREYSGGNNG